MGTGFTGAMVFLPWWWWIYSIYKYINIYSLPYSAGTGNTWVPQWFGTDSLVGRYLCFLCPAWLNNEFSWFSFLKITTKLAYRAVIHQLSSNIITSIWVFFFHAWLLSSSFCGPPPGASVFPRLFGWTCHSSPKDLNLAKMIKAPPVGWT